MKLPNSEHAIVDIAKLRDYCLDATHLRGQHKARVFPARLGITASQAKELRDKLLEIARTEKATALHVDENGQRFVVDFTMKGPAGEARVRSGWIVRTGEDFPRLTSCYVM